MPYQKSGKTEIRIYSHETRHRVEKFCKRLDEKDKVRMKIEKMCQP